MARKGCVVAAATNESGGLRSRVGLGFENIEQWGCVAAVLCASGGNGEPEVDADVGCVEAAYEAEAWVERPTGKRIYFGEEKFFLRKT